MFNWLFRRSKKVTAPAQATRPVKRTGPSARTRLCMDVYNSIPSETPMRVEDITALTGMAWDNNNTFINSMVTRGLLTKTSYGKYKKVDLNSIAQNVPTPPIIERVVNMRQVFANAPLSISEHNILKIALDVLTNQKYPPSVAQLDTIRYADRIVGEHTMVPMGTA
jgi:hypothetical protein